MSRYPCLPVVVVVVVVVDVDVVVDVVVVEGDKNPPKVPFNKH